MSFLHRLAHWIGWNYGSIETWTDERGVRMVGFRCSCGELRSVEAMPAYLQRPQA